MAQQCSSETRVMLLGAANDIHLYKQLIAMGLTDYFSGDTHAEQILGSIERTFSDIDPNTQARVIAFIGAGGGVGSSSIAANTAWGLADTYEEKVTLVDLDLAFGTSSLEFNIDSKQTVADALDQPDRLDNALVERFLAPYNDHVSVLTAPANLAERQNIGIESIELLLGLVRKLSNFVVLDLPNVWHSWVQELLLQADETVIVAYPDLAGVRNTKNMLEFLEDGRGVDTPARLLLNKIGASKKTELRVKDFETAVERVPLFSIQYEPIVFGTAMNNGELVVTANKHGKVTQKLMRLSKEISGRLDPEKSRPSYSFLPFLRKK